MSIPRDETPEGGNQYEADLKDFPEYERDGTEGEDKTTGVHPEFAAKYGVPTDVLKDGTQVVPLAGVRGPAEGQERYREVRTSSGELSHSVGSPSSDPREITEETLREVMGDFSEAPNILPLGPNWLDLTYNERIIKGVGTYREHALCWQRYIDWSYPNFRFLYHQTARGHDKTERGAWWMLLAGLTTDHANFYAAGTDRDNAKLFRDAAKWIIHRHPHLFSEYRANNYEIIHRGNGTTLRILASDEQGNYGLTPELLLVNDFHAWTNQGFWEALFSSMGKKYGSRIWIESNALAIGTPQAKWVKPVRTQAQNSWEGRVPLSKGSEGNANASEGGHRVRDKELITVGNSVVEGPDWFFFRPPGFWAIWQWHMLSKWREGGLSQASFDRLIRNQDIQSTLQYLTDEQVEACEVSGGPLKLISPKYRAVYCIAVDIGVTKDAAVVAVLSMHQRVVREKRVKMVHNPETGKNHVSEEVFTGPKVLFGLHAMAIWTGSRAEPIQIDDVVSYAKKQRARIKKLTKATVYLIGDEYELRAEMQRDRVWEPFKMNTTNIQKITRYLYSDIITRSVMLYRNCAPAMQKKSDKLEVNLADAELWDLKKELTSAVLKQMPYGERVDHQADGFNDRLTALGMALVHLRDRESIPTEEVYLSDGDEDLYVNGKLSIMAAVAKMLAPPRRQHKEIAI